jgi:hypothetical protein
LKLEPKSDGEGVGRKRRRRRRRSSSSSRSSSSRRADEYNKVRA